MTDDGTEHDDLDEERKARFKRDTQKLIEEARAEFISKEDHVFFDLEEEFRKCAELMDLKESPSYREGNNAFADWMVKSENPVFERVNKIKTLNAFALFYREIGLEEHAGRVTAFRDTLTFEMP